MSFSITLFGPRHHFWSIAPRAWFYRPDKHSTGGIGFCVPGLHVVFMWGKDKKRPEHNDGTGEQNG